MKVVQINATSGIGSTGKICRGISKILNDNNIENYIFHTKGNGDGPNDYRYMQQKEIKFAALKSRILGNWGFNSKKATVKLINALKGIKPDIVHLHNMHGHNCNLELLLKHLKENRVKVIWTFHDCWAYTGYCVHYEMVNCYKWQKECFDCPQKKKYTWLIDNSKRLFYKKRNLLKDLDLTIVTPSEWLFEEVKKSFLKGKTIRVINNGINTDIFKPTDSAFRERYGLDNKHIVLGVAFDWGIKKGLDVFEWITLRK